MVYMYHSFLVHSSADGHLGCFHVLAMTNSAAMNIGVCFLFNNMPFPSPHHISIRLLCKTSSLPELVWRPRGANEHLGHSCTPNQVFASFHWPEVGQQASPLIHHLPLLHR